jgi:hypothetical protein
MRTTVALLMVAAFFAASTSVSAQSDDKTTPPEWVAIDDSLGHVLGLTNDQMKQVQEADERYAKAKDSGDASALEKRDTDLRAVLLPSQYEQWKQIVKQRKSGSPPPKK